TTAPMQQIKIQTVGTKATQATLTSGNSAIARSIAGQYLADQENLITAPFDRFTYQLFGCAITIHLGGVDQIQSQIQTCTQSSDLGCATVGMVSHIPGPLTQYWNSFSGRKFRGLHTCLSVLHSCAAARPDDAAAQGAL